MSPLRGWELALRSFDESWRERFIAGPDHFALSALDVSA
jgi:hypothetical protein